jgi:exodeoxyribonuclease VII small subunit
VAKALIDKAMPENSGLEKPQPEKLAPGTSPDISAMAFEQAMAELEAIVDRLEKGSVPLEESLGIYERGETLKKHCDSLLKAAEHRIEKITLGSNGTPSGTKPLDVEDPPLT